LKPIDVCLTYFIAQDEVFAVDLEKAVQYALVNEVPTQAVIASDKLSTLYMFLEVVAKYLPLRQPIKDFVVSLREWPVRMGLSSITSDAYKEKVRLFLINKP